MNCRINAEVACPACGAVWPAGRSCQATFDEFLTWEFAEAAYGEVHFLTVAVFMTQHGRYSDAAQAWITRQLHAHLIDGVPVEQIRQAAQHTTGQPQRDWKVARQPGEPPARRIEWDMTIADVVRAHEAAELDAAAYRAAITEWARATLRQLEANDDP